MTNWQSQLPNDTWEKLLIRKSFALFWISFAIKSLWVTDELRAGTMCSGGLMQWHADFSVNNSQEDSQRGRVGDDSHFYWMEGGNNLEISLLLSGCPEAGVAQKWAKLYQPLPSRVNWNPSFMPYCLQAPVRVCCLWFCLMWTLR